MAQEKTIIIMPLRLLVNFVLLFSVTGLAVFLITDKDKEIVVEEITLTDIDPESIHVIRIERRDLDGIIFQKQDDHWDMQSPFNLPANPSRIKVMLKLLQAHSYDHFSAADNDLTPFMLAVPAVSIILNDTRIAFGDTNQLEEKLRYVLIKETVHIINDSLFHQLQASATFFLDSKLIPRDAEIKAIQLPELNIKKSEDGKLSGTHHQIINAWNQAESISVRKYEEIEPIDTIKLELTSGEIIEFVIVSNRPNLILARPDKGIQYHISSAASDNLFPATPAK
ncbi:MAG: hypothetical protein ACI9ZT_000108 [Gammaproteobacteria bacterium]